jgi:hypothetical protein
VGGNEGLGRPAHYLLRHSQHPRHPCPCSRVLRAYPRTREPPRRGMCAHLRARQTRLVKHPLQPDRAVSLNRSKEANARVSGLHWPAPLPAARRPVASSQMAGRDPEQQALVERGITQRESREEVICGAWGGHLRLNMALEHALTSIVQSSCKYCLRATA